MGYDLDYGLAISRALHFAATLSLVGAAIFQAFVARGLEPGEAGILVGPGQVGRYIKTIFWTALAVAAASGVLWFLCVAAAIDDRPWRETVADGTAFDVLTGTQFGHVFTGRMGLLALVSAAAFLREPRTRCAVLATLGIAFAGSLALAGHAASAPGLKGDIHLASDVVHLVAASAWLGSLLPFVLVLAAAERGEFRDSGVATLTIAHRFSRLALVAVLALVATGLINTLNLVGSMSLLVATDYGRLLSVKISIFAVMLGFAAINRVRLIPRLPEKASLIDIKRNAKIEAALGLLVVAIVAALGTLPPAFHNHVSSKQALDTGQAITINARSGWALART